MPNSPLFSVVLTSYNYGQYIREAIESVFAQSNGNIELIIVDDGSRDNSREVIEKTIAQSPIKVETVFKERNEGQASAFNTGYPLTAGEYVSFLDSDDYWRPDRVERVVTFAELAPGAGLYQHQLDTGKGEKRGGMVSADVFDLLKKWDGGTFNIADDPTRVLISPFVPTSGLTFPRTVLESLFPIPEDIVTCPDAYLTRTAITQGPLVSVPVTLGVWRDHGENVGKTERADFRKYWLPTILPALNRFYEANDLGLRLYFDERHRSRVPASFMLGEYGKMRKEAEQGGAYRAVFNPKLTPRTVARKAMGRLRQAIRGH